MEPYPYTEDEITFGRGVWVYCRDHVGPHKTGWCSVPKSHKVGLGVDNYDDALAKCKLMDLPLVQADLDAAKEQPMK